MSDLGYTCVNHSNRTAQNRPTWFRAPFVVIMESSPPRVVARVRSPHNNRQVVEIEDAVHEGLDYVKHDIRQFLSGFRQYPVADYLMTSPGFFSAKMTVHSIMEDARKLLRSVLTTMFYRPGLSPPEQPLTSTWLVVHIAQILCTQIHDLSQRHFFHVPRDGNFDVVYLDENMMINGRQIIYLCVAPMSDENMEPARVELFRRGAGLEEPERSFLEHRIIECLSQMLS